MPKAAQNSTPQRLARIAPRLREELLQWYQAHHRPLPWRKSPSLYKTVVSEFMLQQTQVETVLPYFGRWLKKFPDFKALAAARESDVLREWEGLGYYRRARLLHALARELVQFPQPPRAPEQWLELPGVGAYTAAAITSITYSAPVAVVDGNVVRVLARLLGDGTRFKDGSAAVKAFTPAANALANPAHPGDHNQAMMELGATVCTKHNPRCGICPLLKWCAAAARGTPEEFPCFEPKRMTRTNVIRLWIERDGALLLHRRAADSRRLAEMCELPDSSAVPHAIPEPHPWAVKRRTIVNQLFIENIHRASLPVGRTCDEMGSGLLWATPPELLRLTLSGPHRKWIAELRAQAG